MPRSRPRTFTRILSAVLTLTLVGSVVVSFAPTRLVPPASAAVWTVDPSGRTEAQMRTRWEQLKPTYTGAAYAVPASVVAPYSAGSTTTGFQTDGINMINFGRYLAGLPSDVTMTATRNTDAQHGAVLLKVIGFSHYPSPKPADMEQAFYDRGYASTSRSNIGSGYSDAEGFQKACLDDADSKNIQKVGHRRWLLNPRMLYTGIGFAENRLTTYAIDSSRPSADVNYSYIAWPSPGVFPVEFASGRTPWSITLNPSKYSWDASVGFTVSMRRLSDGRTWTLNGADTNTSGEYFTANFNSYGVNNAFIFRPDPATISYKPGDQFDITLSGGIYAAGTKTPVTVSYRTSFGALTGATTTFAASTLPGGAPAPAPAPAPDPVSGSTYEQNNPSILRTGAWTGWSSSLLSGGSYVWTNSPGGTATVTFDGTKLEWITATAPAYGIAKVTVDGGTPRLVDLYSSSLQYQRNVWNSGDLPAGKHTVVIEWTGTKNKASSGTYVGIDALGVSGSLLNASAGTAVEQDDKGVIAGGIWNSWASTSLSGSSYAWTNSAGGSATVTFNGRRLDWVTCVAPGYGIARVRVDGGPAQLVDLYSPTLAYQRSVWSTGVLAEGRHTVTIEWTGTKNPASAGTYIGVDALSIGSTLVRPNRYEQDDASIVRTGSWTNWASGLLSGGTYAWSNSARGSTTIAFDGTKLDWLTCVAPSYGIAKVTVDGGPAQLVDLYSQNLIYQRNVWSTGILPNGRHTVTIEWTGTKRAASTGTFVGVDAVLIEGTIASAQ